MSGTCPTCGKPLEERQYSEDALMVLGYWQERTGHRFRTAKASEKALARISARLKEGFSVADLSQAVDAARASRFYREQGYDKQPEVIWRDAARVESLLGRGGAPGRPVPL